MAYGPMLMSHLVLKAHGPNSRVANAGIPCNHMAHSVDFRTELPAVGKAESFRIQGLTAPARTLSK